MNLSRILVVVLNVFFACFGTGLRLRGPRCVPHNRAQADLEVLKVLRQDSVPRLSLERRLLRLLGSHYLLLVLYAAVLSHNPAIALVR